LNSGRAFNEKSTAQQAVHAMLQMLTRSNVVSERQAALPGRGRGQTCTELRVGALPERKTDETATQTSDRLQQRLRVAVRNGDHWDARDQLALNAAAHASWSISKAN
jgi:hypothetical protein